MAAELIYRASSVGDDYPDEVSVTSIVDVAEELTGTRGALDMTGGNCACVTVPLEGAALGITDGDLFTYSDGEWQAWYQGWTACVYTVAADGSWSDEPTAYAYADGSSADVLRDVIRRALAGERQQ